MRTCSTQVKSTKENGKTLKQAVKRPTAYVSGREEKETSLSLEQEEEAQSSKLQARGRSCKQEGKPEEENGIFIQILQSG
ncbi:MAG: hypothetical protein GVY19_05955 [Bacteroidetes bacterium]|nr:hypothetical protein [Bacteroidota bacterium]